MEKFICQLPGGYVDSEKCIHKQAELRPLTGREEELLATTSTALPSAALVTRVLSRCVLRIGDMSPVTETVVRDLLIGDRQYLLLQLRALTFGEQIQATLACPWPDCGKRVDIDFSLTAIPVKTVEVQSLSYTITLPSENEEADAERRVQFRLPNGGDQETVSPLLAQNEAEALTVLLHRCIQSVDQQPPSLELIRNLSSSARLAIEQQMETLAPGIELTMETQCPECGREFTAPFDLQDFFFGEFRTSLDLLRREIHYLAFHYHWSENDILSMTRDKRRSYIEILAAEIEKMNDAIE
jgi:hypothetical protein